VKSLLAFLKDAAIGGIVFLVPVVVVLIILGKAVEMMRKVAAPIDQMIPLESVGGVGLETVIAMLLVLAVCVSAGVIARSFIGQRFYGWVDATLLKLVPGYGYIKSVASGLSDEQKDQLKPVLVHFDDLAQLGFEVEHCADGRVIVFMPGAPETHSGDVICVAADRVEALDVRFNEVLKSLRGLGTGSAGLIGRRVS